MNKQQPLTLQIIEADGKKFDERLKEILSTRHERGNHAQSDYTQACHAEVRRLTGQAKEMCTQLVEARSEISRLTKENADFSVTPGGTELLNPRGRAEKAESNVSKLEKLCGLRGIDPNQVVGASNLSREVSESAFAEKMKSAKTPQERAALSAEVEAAVREKRLVP
jgi:hypothetical protein